MSNAESVEKQAARGTGLSVRSWIAAIAVVAIAGLLARQWHGQIPSANLPTVAAEPSVALLHLEPFVVNLADDERSYLRVGIDLGVSSDAATKSKGKQGNEYAVAVARDTILSVLTARGGSQLQSAEDREALKKDLKKALTSRVPELGVREIYFTEFLLQR